MSLSSGDRDYMDGAGDGYAQAQMESEKRIRELEAKLSLNQKHHDTYAELVAQDLTTAKAENARLRSCLKRSQFEVWCNDPVATIALRCSACGETIWRYYEDEQRWSGPESHASECWLSRELEAK